MLSRLWSLVLLSLACQTSATIFVHPDTPQCKSSGSALRCDFEFAKENVVIEPQPEEKMVTSVYIYNANKVIIPRAVCMDLSFYTVNIVHFATNNVCQKKLINLRLVDSVANQVPRQLSRLEVTRSEVKKVVCDYGLQRLSVVNSKIEEFDAPWPVAGSITMKIESSTIDTFKSLNIEGKVFLVITNSTLNSMARESLILGKGVTATIVNSFITTEENAIVVKTGARFSFKGTEGKISIMGSPPGKEESDRRPPGVPQVVMTPPTDPDSEWVPPKPTTDEISCKSDSITWVWFVPTVLATIEAIAIIVMCGNKRPSKRKTSLVPDSENLSSVGSSYSYGTPPTGTPYYDSSLSFYSESGSGFPTTLKRR